MNVASAKYGKPVMTAGKQTSKQQQDKKPTEEDKAKRKEESDYIDEALEETFPASDPMSPPIFDDSKN